MAGFQFHCGETGKVSNDIPAGSKRPLALLFGWVGSTPRLLTKYAEVYGACGMDALVVSGAPKHVLRPVSSGRATVQALIDCVKEHPERDLVCMGFSVGAYMYGHLLNLVADDAALRNRIRGQVFDSPVDFYGVPYGLSTAITGGEGLPQRLLQRSVELYMSLFHSAITVHYIASSDAFHGNTLTAPSLWLYSSADKVTSVQAIEDLSDKWRARGTPVERRNFGTSKHVEHLRSFPDDYRACLSVFLQNLNFMKV
ncbi:hypothetical protein M885DRAFT_562370 [Pelagophyceae sp. CCMP2097]|nr:hypothetical protein M885DRAFT_562370 [Pelagophyceae sp. CCMP2097]